jgi:hypothetical protein
LYCQGLMASLSRMRHTVVRPIGLPRAPRTRWVTSARDWRLKGCLVWATNSQATALTTAWSKGGKGGLAATSRGVGHGEMACGPALPPAQHLAARQADAPPRLLLGQVGVLVQQEDQTTTLDGLLRGGLAPERGPGLLQEVVGKDRAKGRQKASHGGHPFRKGKTELSICCLLYDIPRNPDIICGTDH